MPAAQRKPLNPFNESDTLDDATAETEELAQPQEQPPAQEEPPGAAEPQTLEPVAEPQTKADRRWNQLLEERKAMQEQSAQLQRQVAESNERWARLDERRRQLDESRQAAEHAVQQQQQAAQRPDPTIDPVGAELYDLRQFKQQQEQWRQQIESQFGQAWGTYQQNQQQQEFQNWIVAEAQSYQRQHPDYLDAVNHLAQWRTQWWMELGATPETARNIVVQESQALAQLARQNGKSFPDVLYRLAPQVGYKTANGNGQPKTVPSELSAAGRTLAQAAKGQAMQGLGRAPVAGNEGKSRYKDFSAADIASMSEREWSAAMADPTLKAELEYAMRKADQVLDYEDANYGGRR